MREVVRQRLVREFGEQGLCVTNLKVRLALACGNMKSEQDRTKIESHFAQRGWVLFDEHWIRGSLKAVAQEAYENDATAMDAATKCFGGIGVLQDLLQADDPGS